jgi:protein-S-isoprenylcysteine O-methyltransferase Ste14
MYLAATLLYAGVALSLSLVWTLAALIPCLVVLHYGVILREERYLEGKFGQRYLDYRARVRRWL